MKTKQEREKNKELHQAVVLVMLVLTIFINIIGFSNSNFADSNGKKTKKTGESITTYTVC